MSTSVLIRLDEARLRISNIVDANARAASHLVLGAAMVELTRIRPVTEPAPVPMDLLCIVQIIEKLATGGHLIARLEEENQSQ